MRSDEARDRTARVRQAANRADAMRSIMPLCAVEEAVEVILNRQVLRAAERRELKR